MRIGFISPPASSSIVAAAKKSDLQKGSGQAPLRITTNVKQNLQFLKLWREFQKRKSSTPKPATSYRKKKSVKEELPEDTDLYQDPTTTLYYTNQGLVAAVPVLLVDGYNVCGYWAKLKKHFVKGRLDIARQKLLDDLITFSVLKEVKVVAVFDAMLSGLPNHKESFAGIDVIFSSDTCADAWIEKEIVALREDGCPKVWVVTSDVCHQQAAHGAGAFVWSCKALVSEGILDQVSVDSVLQTRLQSSYDQHYYYPYLILSVPDKIKASEREFEQILDEHRSTSMQGKLLQHNLGPEVVGALKDLKKKLIEEESS